MRSLSAVLNHPNPRTRRSWLPARALPDRHTARCASASRARAPNLGAYDGAGHRPATPGLVSLQAAAPRACGPAAVPRSSARTAPRSGCGADGQHGCTRVTRPRRRPRSTAATCDPAFATEFPHGLFAPIVLKNKSKLFFHYTVRLPQHARPLREALPLGQSVGQGLEGTARD